VRVGLHECAKAVLTLLKYAVVTLGAAYLLVLLLLYAFQERLIFLGDPLPADHRFAFDQTFEEVPIPVEGATLDALHFTQPGARGLVFFIHGNAGNLATWTTGVDFYRKAGYDLFMFDFRGYGKSSGRISGEAQLHADVRAAYDAIAPRYAGRPIVIYGRSLGSGLAARLALDVDPALLVLVTPYSSLEAVARRLYPWAPAALLRYPLRTDALLPRLRTPLVLLHGTRDLVIPVEQSRTLRDLARAPAELVTVEGAGHNDLQEYPAYREALLRALDRAAGLHRPP
jgi:alpha-beta hydrolase superfamily lysophospholipase